MKMRDLGKLTVVLFLAASTASLVEANNLLPQPREMTLGEGRLPLSRVRICTGDSNSEEDLFAARELASFLTARGGREIPVSPCRGGANTILLKRTAEADPLPIPGESTGAGSREAYSVRIDATSAEVSARSSAGVFYGVQTVKQLLDAGGSEVALIECNIRDWPEDAYRGFMMDMSHTQLPTVAELKRQIDFLAHWKVNLYLFYSEASIELEGYPLLMEGGRFTKDEVREIIDYGRQRHMEVVPNLELYGHLHDLLRLEQYSDMAVFPHGGEFNRSDPRVSQVVRDFVSQVAELFPGPFFHIGFDETWLLEQEAKKLGEPPEKLYVEQLKEVVEIVESYGKRPLAWADMMQKFPHAIAETPEEIIWLPWHYFPLDSEEYAERLDPFAEHDRSMMVQGAVLNWTHLLPENRTAYENTDLLLREGRARGAIGFIMSGWTDDSIVLTRLERPVMAHAAASGWQSQPVDRTRFYDDYSRILYSNEVAPHVARAWGCMDQAESSLQNALGRNTINPLWADPFTAEYLELSVKKREDFRQARLAAENAQEEILQALAGGEDGETLRAMLTGARLVDYAAMRYLYVGDMVQFWDHLGSTPSRDDVFTLLYFELGYKYHTRTADLMEVIMELKEQQRQAWLVEFTPFRLGVAMGKFDSEFQSWWRVQQAITNLALGFEEGDTLPPLESLGEQF